MPTSARGGQRHPGPVRMPSSFRHPGFPSVIPAKAGTPFRPPVFPPKAGIHVASAVSVCMPASWHLLTSFRRKPESTPPPGVCMYARELAPPYVFPAKAGIHAAPRCLYVCPRVGTSLRLSGESRNPRRPPVSVCMPASWHLLTSFRRKPESTSPSAPRKPKSTEGGS